MNDILNIIATGSKGNCYIYNDDLMIDIGVPYNKINKYKSQIKLLLLTHQHSDHLNITTLKKLLYEKPTLTIICCDFLADYLSEKGIKSKKIYVLEPNKKYDLCKYIIQPIYVYHDVPNCAYKIIIKNNNYKIFHSTDAASLEHIEAKDFDLYAVEGNYDEEELQERIAQKQANEEYVYEYRVQNTHLSEQKAYDWLLKNMSDKSQYVLLHKHIE